MGIFDIFRKKENLEKMEKEDNYFLMDISNRLERHTSVLTKIELEKASKDELNELKNEVKVLQEELKKLHHTQPISIMGAHNGDTNKLLDVLKEPHTVAEIRECTGWSNQKIYRILKTLESNAVVTYQMDGRKKRYYAHPP